MNRLEIKYYNNVDQQVELDSRLISNGGYHFKYEIIDKTLNDFYEFYIDGESLLARLLKPNSNPWFMKNKNGLLGTRDKIYDELLVNALLKKEVNSKSVKKHFNKYNKSIKDEHIPSLIYELGLSNPFIYGCKICGDRDCGGIDIKVEKDSKYYYWNTYNEDTFEFDKYTFKFQKLEYEEVFKDYLKNWKKTKTREINYH